MRRILSCILAVGAFGAVITPVVHAQQEEAPAYVRESYYKVNFADYDVWNSTYVEKLAPILAGMVEEGLVAGFGAQMHYAGGDYNWRLVTTFADWASIETGTNELIARIGAADVGDVGSMILAHTDNIWRLTDFSPPDEGSQPGFFYIWSYHVANAGLEAWNEFYADIWQPALEEARANGLLEGWAVEEHAHGGNMNWQILLMLNDWDQGDDVWASFFEAFSQNEARWMATTRSILAHEDYMWETIPVDGN